MVSSVTLFRLVRLGLVPFFSKALRFHMIAARSTHVNLRRFRVVSAPCSEPIYVVSSAEYGVSAISLRAYTGNPEFSVIHMH